MSVSRCDIGRVLRALRVARGMDREEVSAQLGGAPSRLASIEQGMTKQDVEECSRIANRYGWRLSAVIAMAEAAATGQPDLLQAALTLTEQDRTRAIAALANLRVASPAPAEPHVAPAVPWAGGLPSQAECERRARVAGA